MRFFRGIACLFAFSVGLFGQTGFSTEWIEQSVDPCTNFYQYACGVWLKKNPIPSDQTSWGRFNEVYKRNQAILKEILEENAAKKTGRTQIEQQIGDFYGSCMDEEAVEKRGIGAIRPELDRIAGIESKKDLAGMIARLHRSGINAAFHFGPTPDFKNSSMNIGEVDQGGLGLPDRDYYFRDDAKSKEQREQYVAHIGNMFRLLGDSAGEAERKAGVVMRLETALAKGSLGRVARRDPKNVYHKMPFAKLERMDPSFDWNSYTKGIGAPAMEELNVAVPGFVEAFESLLDAASLEDWKVYLRWRLLSNSADYLPRAFVKEDFDFYTKKLRGGKEMKPRWKRCVRFSDRMLGEALGRKYVEKAYPPEAKQRMSTLVAAVEQALGEDIEGVGWMTAATKRKALEKLHAIQNKIGYPVKWRDYSTLKITPGDFLGNVRRAAAHELEYKIAKIGKPVNKQEWGMTPSTVNAYYDPLENNINFPAGILQPPFFDFHIDAPVNFGGIGAVIGHELTHGFDDSGRQFGPNGNLEDWWTAADAAAFERKAQCFVDQYSAYTAVDDVKVNGKLTLGENTADNGGLRVAFMALMETLDAAAKKKEIDGYTPAQRLFLGWAQVWCTNTTDEMERLRAQTDPHSPGRYRVNGVVSNMPEFQQAFTCAESKPMVRAHACRVW